MFPVNFLECGAYHDLAFIIKQEKFLFNLINYFSRYHSYRDRLK